MQAWDVATLLGVQLDAATRIVLLHERARSFRPFGILEVLLKVLAAIVLIPFWIYLLVASMSVGGGDGGDAGGGGDDSGPRPDKKRRFSVSALFEYHHDLVVRVFGKNGVLIHDARARVANADEGRRLVASVLAAAQANGLIVVESVGEAGQELHDPVQFWYGGRPLMARPELRPLDELESRLRAAGFEPVIEEGNAVLRRIEAPPHPAIGLLIIGMLVYVGVLAASLWLLPAVLFALFLLRKHAGDVAIVLASSLLRFRDRQELVVTASSVSYKGARGWRRFKASIGSDALLAVGTYGTLGWTDGVQRAPAQLHLVGRETTVLLPEAFTEGAEKLVGDWVTAQLLARREGLVPVALRSRCTYCGTLVDFGASSNCPSCAAPFLGRTG